MSDWEKIDEIADRMIKRSEQENKRDLDFTEEDQEELKEAVKEWLDDLEGEW